MNNYTGEIKTRCKENKIKVGMFCYSTNSGRKTVLKDFGFSYDQTLKAFKEYNQELDIFTNIDFFFGLDLKSTRKSTYFIMRDYYGYNTLFLKDPVIDYFFDIFKE